MGSLNYFFNTDSSNTLELLNDLAAAVSLLGEPSGSFTPEERWRIEDVILRALLEREEDKTDDILAGLKHRIGNGGVVFNGDDASRTLLSVVLMEAGVGAEEIRVCELTSDKRFERWLLAVRTFEEQTMKRDSRARIMARRYLWSLSELWRRGFVENTYEADVLMRLYFNMPLGEGASPLDKDDSRFVAEDLADRGIVSEKDHSRFLEKESVGQVRNVTRRTVNAQWDSVGLFCSMFEEAYPERARSIIGSRYSGPLSDFCWINDDFKDDVADYIFQMNPIGVPENIRDVHSKAMVSVALRERLLRQF